MTVYLPDAVRPPVKRAWLTRQRTYAMDCAYRETGSCEYASNGQAVNPFKSCECGDIDYAEAAQLRRQQLDERHTATRLPRHLPVDSGLADARHHPI